MREYLEDLKASGGEQTIADLVEKIEDMRVLVVGDAIVDQYHYVSAIGKSGKENIIATQLLNSEMFAGGVFATANHVASFCRRVDVLTCLGHPAAGANHEDMIRASLRPNVRLIPMYRAGAPTTLKTRFVEPTYVRKLFEVYTMDDSPLEADQRAEFDDLLAAHVRDYDVVIVNDFGHSLIALSTIRILEERSPFLAVNAQSNAANTGFNLITKYKHADYICLDVPEAQLAVGDKSGSVERICSELLPQRVDCGNIIVTHGKLGCYAYQAGRSVVVHIPALTSQIVDTVGAGDAFLAVTAPMVAAGGDIEHVAFIGNIAGAIKVGIIGHRNFVEKSVVKKFASTLLK